eukprot:138375-Prorocentrum_minimum.AAC.5
MARIYAHKWFARNRKADAVHRDKHIIIKITNVESYYGRALAHLGGSAQVATRFLLWTGWNLRYRACRKTLNGRLGLLKRTVPLHKNNTRHKDN